MSMESFKAKLDNYNGLYPLNLAIEEENVYYLEQIGGEEQLKNKFPTLYTAYTNARANAMNQNQAAVNDFVRFAAHDIVSLPASANGDTASDLYFLAASFSGSFLDKSTSVANAVPAKTFHVSINGKVYDPNSPRLPYMEIHDSFYQVNQLDRQYQSEDAYHKEEFWNRTLKFKFIVNVYDESNALSPFAYSSTKSFGNPMDYVIDNIHIDAPVSTHPQTNEIRILYGRSAANLDKPDYTYSSNHAEDHSGNLWTIIPIKGHVTLKSILSSDNYNSFEKLAKPDEGEPMSRSTLQYAGKDWKIFRNDLKDSQLYDLMTKSNFTVKAANNAETLTFDLFNPGYATGERRYDWAADIDKAATDNRERICFLVGGFEYDICKKNKSGQIIEPGTGYQIEIRSVKTEDLPKNRTYYTFAAGSGTIYIPPVHLWWGCYARDTQMTMADGSTKRADDIKIGDKMPCYRDIQLTVDNIYTGEEKNLICIHTDGARIRVSTGHPMLLESGTGIAAERLRAGDKIVMADYTSAEVTAVEITPYEDIVYNFSFEGEEEGNYLKADGFYSGDFYMQNMLRSQQPDLTEEQNKLCAELQDFVNYLSNQK